MDARRTAGALAATCSVFLLGACGGGGQSASSGSGTSAVSTSSSSSTASPAGPAGTSASSDDSSSKSAAPAAAVKISIKDFKYQVPISVKPGAKITVTNSDNVNHTVTSDKSGLFDVVTPSGGGDVTITAPTKPGKYPFHCKYHANMHGVLVVS